MFTVLARDHEEVEEMLADLEKGPSRAGGVSQDQLALRKKMTERLIIENPGTRRWRRCTSGRLSASTTRRPDTLADEATGQEQEPKGVLARLDKLDPGEAEFEETRVWPGLRQVLPAETAGELGSKIAEGKKTAPTRPHPHTPPSTGTLKAVDPAVAAADKARDAVTGRGKD
jgi:hypothetical protein